MSIRGALIVCVSCALWVAGCAGKPPPKPPAPVETKAVISAAPDANPDANGRPSPVVVRVYQLRGDAEFAGASYFALYEQEKATLGASLIMRDEKDLLVGQSIELTLSLSPDARFLGAIAGLYDVKSTHWRALVPLPPPQPNAKKPVERHVNVRVEKEGINVSVSN